MKNLKIGIDDIMANFVREAAVARERLERFAGDAMTAIEEVRKVAHEPPMPGFETLCETAELVAVERFELPYPLGSNAVTLNAHGRELLTPGARIADRELPAGTYTAIVIIRRTP